MNIHKELPLSFPGCPPSPGPLTPFYTNIATLPSITGGEGNEGSGSEGEESGTQFSLNETYDVVRNGARLILRYDAGTNAFTGTVENTTTGSLSNVRIEVHLSNGVELGPTTPTDLAPGQVLDINLPAPAGGGFNQWSAHPEVG